MDLLLLAVAGAVRLGMLPGEIPGLALDRTGVALLGAIALLATGRIAPESARDAVDVSTIALLAALILLAGVLPAVLANDIVCLAMAPVLVADARQGGRPRHPRHPGHRRRVAPAAHRVIAAPALATFPRAGPQTAIRDSS